MRESRNSVVAFRGEDGVRGELGCVGLGTWRGLVTRARPSELW